MKRFGFTLIELMIVVAIIAVLAGTAVPVYHAYINEAAHAEAQTIIVDIASKEEAYHSAWNSYITATDGYEGSLSSSSRAPQSMGDVDSEWTRLGYQFADVADGGLFGGPLYYRYQVNAFNDNGVDSYIVGAFRNKSNSEKECAELRSDNRRSIAFNQNDSGTCGTISE